MEGKDSNSIRSLWRVGSEIEIYSKSKNKWFMGKIVKIINDKEGEWLRVRYNCKSIKEIQRLNHTLRPRGDLNDKINRAIEELTLQSCNDLYWQSYALTEDVFGEGAEALICGTEYRKKRGDLNDNIQIITKIYELPNPTYAKELFNWKINRIIREYYIFNDLKLIDFRNTLPSYNKDPCDDYNMYWVMEKLKYSLQSLYDENIRNKMSSIELKYFILEVTGCLHKLHSIGYAHLDINPHNIMYNNNNNTNIYYGNGWKIIDGGSMEQIDYNTGYKEIPHYRGKMGYTAPEMINGKHKVTKAADTWSLAVVILFALYVLPGGFCYEPASNFFANEEIQNMLKIGDFNALNNKIFEYYHQTLIKIDMKKYLLKHLNEKVFDSGLYNLLLRMLQFNPLKRPSMIEIINDKYFKDIIKKTPNGIEIKDKINTNKYKLLVNMNTIIVTDNNNNKNNKPSIESVRGGSLSELYVSDYNEIHTPDSMDSKEEFLDYVNFDAKSRDDITNDLLDSLLKKKLYELLHEQNPVDGKSLDLLSVKMVFYTMSRCDDEFTKQIEKLFELDEINCGENIEIDQVINKIIASHVKAQMIEYLNLKVSDAMIDEKLEAETHDYTKDVNVNEHVNGIETKEVYLPDWAFKNM